MADPFLDERAEGRVGLEPGQQDDLRPGAQTRESDGRETVRPGERERHDGAVPRPDSPDRAVRGGGPDLGPVRADDPLGLSSRSRGVQDQDEVLLVDVGRRDLAPAVHRGLI